MSRNTPYTTIELENILAQGTDGQQFDTLCMHVRNGGQLKASTLIGYTSCSNVGECVLMIERINDKVKPTEKR